MSLPARTGQIWPALPNDAELVVQGVRTFLHTPDLGLLAHSAYRTVLGITGGSSTAVDDASAILAAQVFGA